MALLQGRLDTFRNVLTAVQNKKFKLLFPRYLLPVLVERPDFLPIVTGGRLPGFDDHIAEASQVASQQG